MEKLISYFEKPFTTRWQVNFFLMTLPPLAVYIFFSKTTLNVFILVWCGIIVAFELWLHQKVETKKWQRYKAKLDVFEKKLAAMCPDSASEYIYTVKGLQMNVFLRHGSDEFFQNYFAEIEAYVDKT